MLLSSSMRFATVALLLSGLACAKNHTNEQVGAARDSTAMTDSAKANQTKSGVTDTKTGKSTLGPGATKTRPDQGQPVTSKGDTINPGVDSSSSMNVDSTSHMNADSSSHMHADSSSNKGVDTATTPH
jgi:hypothetical protein